MCPTSIKPHSITGPLLDSRNEDELFNQCRELARLLTPGWSQHWGLDYKGNYSKTDPGIAMFHLFGNLGGYLASQINDINNQRKLVFLNFFGMTQRPPWAARTLLSFTHTPDTSSLILPARTRVGYEPPEQALVDEETEAANLSGELSDEPALKDRQIVFETQAHLKVLPAVLQAAYTLEPSQDRYFDQSPADEEANEPHVYKLFGKQPTRPADHLFLIGDPVLFAPGKGLEKLELIFTGENLIPAWFDLWFDGNGAPLNVEITAEARGSQLVFTFPSLPEEREAGSFETALNAILGRSPGEEAPEEEEPEEDEVLPFWLITKPMQGMPVLPRQGPMLPYIQEIQCAKTASQIIPEATFYNDTELDIKNGAQPFGETPAKEDCFYIGSVEVLAKAGAWVRVDFSLETIIYPPDQPITAQLAWEFWDGDNWVNFNSDPQNPFHFVDRSNNFYGDNPEGATFISFQCPPIALSEVGGLESYWIRARIAAGNYGKGFDFEPKSNAMVVLQIPNEILSMKEKLKLIHELKKLPDFSFGYVITDSQYYPPFVKALHMQYRYKAAPAQSVAYNNFQTSNFLHEPYQPMPGLAPAFLMGFGLDGFGEYTVGNRLSLYFQLKNESNSGASSETLLEVPKVSWSYYDGVSWQIMKATDMSRGLARNGVIELPLGSDMKPASFMGRTQYWIRMEDDDLGRKKPIRVLGIWPNTVSAENRETIEDELLGSGNGEPGQKLALSQPFILEGQKIGVIEPTFPTLEEIDIAAKEGHDLQIQKHVLIEGGSHYLVTWKEVDSFALSTSLSRDYIINRMTGEIWFGDGVRGMTVPEGIDNVLAISYDACLGEKGNVEGGVLTVLEESWPQISAVVNPNPASMGRNGDTDESVVQAGPWAMRNNNRAVQGQDFEQLAIEADTSVSKASVVSQPNGLIKVYIYARDHQTQTKAIMPALLENVYDYLQSRMLFTLKSKLVVLPPTYLDIDLFMTVVILKGAEREVDPYIQKKLNSYFNINRGGPRNDGWNFGEDIHLSDLKDDLLKTGQPSMVISIPRLTANGVNKLVPLELDQLPFLETVTVHYRERSSTSGY